MDPVVIQVSPTLSGPWPLPEKVVLPTVFDSFWETTRKSFWQAALCAKCGPKCAQNPRRRFATVGIIILG